MPVSQPSSRFPLGVVLYREPMPLSGELDRDLQILHQQGIHLVYFPVNCAILSPREEDWRWEVYESWLNKARQLSMDLLPVFQVSSLSGWWMTASGHISDPVESFAQFVGRVVERWSTWDEIAGWGVDVPDFRQTEAVMDVLPSARAVEAFSRWLQKQYGDLNALNERWKTAYTAWEEIRPEYWRPQDVPQRVAWQAFLENWRLEWFHRLTQTVHSADARQRPVHVLSLDLPGQFPHPGVPADLPGVSCFPSRQAVHRWDDAAAHPEECVRQRGTALAGMLSVAYAGDRARSWETDLCSFRVVPLQAGPEQTLWQEGSSPSPEELRRWVLTALSAGASGVGLSGVRPGLNPLERGFALLESEGDSSPRMREVASLGKALQSQAELFMQGRLADVQVGIVLDDINRRVCETLPGLGEHYHYSVRGWHRLLWEEGFPMDFVPAEAVDEALAERYRALILPLPLALENESARRLSAYVSAGGNLVSEVGTGMLTEDGWAVPGEFSPLLRYLFGVRVVNQRLVDEPDESPRWSPLEHHWRERDEAGYLEGRGPMEGLRVRASVWVQQIENQGSQPVFWYRGRPAGAFRVGVRGQAWLIGTAVGHSAFAHIEPEARLFVRRLLGWFGVRPQRVGDLLLRRRVLGNQEAWFLTNPTSETVTVQVSVPARQVEDLLHFPMERSQEQLTLTLSPYEVRVIVMNSGQ
ncbi:MAG: beta-galactosidase trimerization domain-containing protein [Anaerolinea sp.]